MENEIGTSTKTLDFESQKSIAQTKEIPTQNQTTDQFQYRENPGHNLIKITTPDRLKVPKAFKFPERYTSPTDLVMSPVTKGLLARGRKRGAFLIPPSKNRALIQDLQSLDCGSIS